VRKAGKKAFLSEEFSGTVTIRKAENRPCMYFQEKVSQASTKFLANVGQGNQPE
jgi:hypothetical protein